MNPSARIYETSAGDPGPRRRSGPGWAAQFGLPCHSCLQHSCSALAEFALDRVAAFQRRVQAFRGIRHEDKMRGTSGEGQQVALLRLSPFSQTQRLLTSLKQRHP